ncbi:hypothetical protein ACFL2B_03235 [Patescibacteria group bacterium]
METNSEKKSNGKKLDQDKIGVWIGVSILVIVGLALAVYGIIMATNPEAVSTMLMGGI